MMINNKDIVSLIVISVIIFSSCSKRKDAINQLNTKPKIAFLVKEIEHKSLTDSLRFDEKGLTFYNLKLRSTDVDNNIWKLYSNVVDGKIRVFYKGFEQLIPSLRVDIPEISLAVQGVETGLNRIEFIAEDRFLQRDTATLNLFIFKNLPPVAKLSYTQLTGSREYQISGIGSYDQDQNYGGHVEGYIFTIEGQSYKTPVPTINYIFQNAGIYTISLKVIDNNEELSKEVSLRINVQ